MQRSVLTLVLVTGAVFVFAGQVLAFQCPKLAAQIDQATAMRYDPTAAGAKTQKAQVMELHSAGKHAESEKLAKEILEKLK
jgi:hypothetical protein